VVDGRHATESDGRVHVDDVRVVVDCGGAVHMGDGVTAAWAASLERCFDTNAIVEDSPPSSYTAVRIPYLGDIH